MSAHGRFMLMCGKNHHTTVKCSYLSVEIKKQRLKTKERLSGLMNIISAGWRHRSRTETAVRSLRACSASDELSRVSRRARTLRSLKSAVTTPGGQAGLVCGRPRTPLTMVWPLCSRSASSLPFQQEFLLLQPGLRPRNKPGQEYTPSWALLTCVLQEPSRNTGDHRPPSSHLAVFRVTKRWPRVSLPFSPGDTVF